MNNNSFWPAHGSWRTVLISLFASLSFLFFLCLISTPLWQTNDDVAMAMISQGYGIAAYPSPNLIFSHVLWGYIVRFIPPVFGVYGYSIATVFILVLTGTIITFGTRYAGAGWTAALALMVLIMTQAVLFPQFTVNAGLLAVCSIICLRIFLQKNKLFFLFLSAILVFLGYLIRDKEALLVLLVGLPLLPWHVLVARRSVWLVAVVLIFLVGLSSLIDHQAYRGEEWQRFKEYNPVRVQFTDFSIGKLFSSRQGVLCKYQYSQNDIDLIASWFCADPEIADPEKLNSLISELGFSPFLLRIPSMLQRSLLNLFHPVLLPIFIAGLIMVLLFPSRKILFSWGLFFAALFLLSCMGRPVMLRVYYPLAALFTVAPLLIQEKIRSRCRYNLMATTLIISAICSVLIVIPISWSNEAQAKKIRDRLAEFPRTPVVVWGAAFPYEKVYPVLQSDPDQFDFKFYGLGSLTMAPNTVAYEMEQEEQFKDRITGDSGLLIVMGDGPWPLLRRYCRERMEGELRELDRKKFGDILVLHRVQCEEGVSPPFPWPLFYAAVLDKEDPEVLLQVIENIAPRP